MAVASWRQVALGIGHIATARTAEPQQIQAIALAGARPGESHDTYALGVSLWMALAGGSPFTADNQAALLEQVLHQPLPALHLAPDPAAVPLQAFVARATARAREARFCSAEAMNEALHSLMRTTAHLSALP